MSKYFVAAIGVSALLAGQVLAQGQPANQTPRGRAPQNPNQASQGNAQQLDQHAAACLLIGNQEEIAMSEFGIEKAESDDVKEFAREMVKEHTKMVSKLRKFTPQQGSFELNIKSEEKSSKNEEAGAASSARAGEAGAAAPRGGEAGRTTAARAGEAAAAKAGTSSGSMMDQLLAIERDKAQHCLEITQKELKEKQGAEFDKAFMGVQVSAHVSMLAKLKALDGKLSGELGELVSEAQKSTEEHLDHAKQIKEKIASASGARTTERAPREGRNSAPPRERDVRESK